MRTQTFESPARPGRESLRLSVRRRNDTAGLRASRRASVPSWRLVNISTPSWAGDFPTKCCRPFSTAPDYSGDNGGPTYARGSVVHHRRRKLPSPYGPPSPHGHDLRIVLPFIRSPYRSRASVLRPVLAFCLRTEPSCVRRHRHCVPSDGEDRLRTVRRWRVALRARGQTLLALWAGFSSCAAWTDGQSGHFP